MVLCLSVCKDGLTVFKRHCPSFWLLPFCSLWVLVTSEKKYIYFPDTKSTTSHKIFKYFFGENCNPCEFFFKWRKFKSNTQYFQEKSEIFTLDVYYSVQHHDITKDTIYHSKIRKARNYGYRFKVHIAIKYWNLTLFQNFQLE